MVTSIIFMGSAEFGIPSLQALTRDERFRIDLVVTNPAKPVGRKKELTLPPLALEANYLDLPLVTPDNKSELVSLMESTKLKPDFLVVIAYGMLIPKIVLDWPKVAPINVHGSLLPRYRGAAPIQAALLNGDKITGNSYMKMNEGLDAGDCYKFSEISLDGQELAPQVFSELSLLAANDLPELLLKIKNNEATLSPQIGEPSYVGKISKEDGLIDFGNETARDIFNKYRAYVGWPGVYFMFRNKRILILSMNLVENPTDDLSPGEFVCVDKKVVFGTIKGQIELLLVRPEGLSDRAAWQFFAE